LIVGINKVEEKETTDKGKKDIGWAKPM